MSEWPDGWVSGAEKIAEEQDARMTNDHGILYMVGDDPRDGEWLHTTEELPPHLENRC